MTLENRRFVYIAFFLAFFVVTPILIAYSLGYRLDLQTLSINKVGAFFVKSYPSGATIELNDGSTKSKTPNQLINVTPGKNILTVTKKGYQPWTKALDVEPGKTTFVENILLFRDAFETRTIGPAAIRSIKTKSGKIAYQTSDNIILELTTATEATSIIGTIPSGAVLISWDDANRLIYKLDENFYVLNTVDLTEFLVQTPSQDPIDSLEFADADSLYVQTGKLVYLIPTSSDTPPRLLLASASSIYSQDGILYAISQDGMLHQYAADTLSDQIMTAVPSTSRIVAVQGDTILVKSGQTFTALRNGNELFQVAADGYDWADNLILFYNSVEIWLANTSTGDVTLIDRTQAQTQVIAWHPSKSYFTSIRNNDLAIIEFDNRGNKRHTISITPLSPSDTFAYNKKGDLLYIVSMDGVRVITIQ